MSRITIPESQFAPEVSQATLVDRHKAWPRAKLLSCSFQ